MTSLVPKHQNGHHLPVLFGLGFLIPLAIVWAYSVFAYGGVLRSDRYLLAAAIGLLGLLWGVFSRKGARPVRGALLIGAILLPLYPLLQLAPLPAGLLRVVSPARVELTAALQPLVEVSSAPISVAPPATFAWFLMMGMYVLTFLMVRDLTARFDGWPWATAVPLLLVAVFQAGLGLVQTFAGPESAPARGTYVNRDHFSGLLEMVLPFTVALPFSVLRRHGRRQSVSVRSALWSSVWFAAAAVLLEGIIYSLSKMGFIAGLLSLVVMALLYWGPGARKRTLWNIASVALAGFIVSFLVLPPSQLILRFAELSNSEGLNAEGRIELSQESTRLLGRFPIFGAGLGGFESAFMRYKVSAPLATDDYVHDDYLQFLIEMGIAGFAVAAIALGAVLREAIRAYSQQHRPDLHFLELACLGSFAAIGLHSFADFNLNIPANAMCLAWICGIASGAADLAKGPSQAQRNSS